MITCHRWLLSSRTELPRYFRPERRQCRVVLKTWRTQRSHPEARLTHIDVGLQQRRTILPPSISPSLETSSTPSLLGELQKRVEGCTVVRRSMMTRDEPKPTDDSTVILRSFRHVTPAIPHANASAHPFEDRHERKGL